MFCKIFSYLLPLCVTTTLTWDIWILVFLFECILVFVLLSDNSAWNLGQFMSYGPWLMLTQIFYSVFCQSWILYWHNALSWVCYSWSEVVINTSNLNFWVSFDVSLFILTSSPQTWWSETSQPTWSSWLVVASVLQEKNTNSWSLLFFMASGALALEAVCLCPSSTIILLVWTMLFWAVFYFSSLGSELNSFVQPYDLFLLLGLNLSPIVLQEYLWILVVGQNCFICIFPWSLLFCWAALDNMLPLFGQNSNMTHFSFFNGVLSFYSFILTFSLF